MKFLFGPLFLVFSAGYFLINNVIMLKDYNIPLPHDAILKTEVIDLPHDAILKTEVIDLSKN